MGLTGVSGAGRFMSGPLVREAAQREGSIRLLKKCHPGLDPGSTLDVWCALCTQSADSRPPRRVVDFRANNKKGPFLWAVRFSTDYYARPAQRKRAEAARGFFTISLVRGRSTFGAIAAYRPACWPSRNACLTSRSSPG